MKMNNLKEDEIKKLKATASFLRKKEFYSLEEEENV
jgi:hypothetical protein